MLRLRNILKPAAPAPRPSDQAARESDAELVRSACQGDKRAFVEIVARHQAMVCGIALSILGDFAGSEDAAQEAFLNAWRKIHTLREPQQLRSWLAQIARTAALGRLRREPRHEELDQAFDLADQAPLPDEAAVNEEEAALVRESLAKLPENYRLPLILYYREGQSVRAVAAALDLSEDAVKQRLARGREMLRDQMSGLVETVLRRTGPTTIFTMTIAVAIGALTAPAAVAGTAFAASSVSAGAASTSAGSHLLAAMNLSNTLLATTTLVALVCIPIGYRLGNTQRPAKTAELRSTAPQPTTNALPQDGPDFEHSSLLAEWRRLHDLYGRTAESMPKLHKAISDLDDRFRRQAFGAALVAEWVQLDPTNGLRFFLAKGRDTNQRQQFFGEWLKVDPRAAVNTLLASDENWDELARDCLKEIARQVPARLAEVVTRLPKAENLWDTQVRDAFSILAESGLPSARAAAETVSGPNRDQALAGVALAWAKQDFNSAVSWAKGLPDNTDRNEVIRGALLGLAAVDPAAALNSVELVPPGGKYAYFASTTGARVLQQAAATDLDSTVAWLTAHPGRFGREDLFGLAKEVTDRLNADPAGFLSAQAANGSLAALLPAMESALLNQASGQRAAVWAWLGSQSETDPVRALKKEVLESAGFQDPDLAMSLVADLPRSPAGDAQVKELARCLFNGGLALDRFDRLIAQAPERLRQPLLEAAFDNLRTDVSFEPQEWVNRLAQLPESTRGPAIEALARAWATQSPENALSWASSLASSQARSSAEAAIVTGWARTDPQGASDWLSSMPAGADRDRSVGSLVQAIAEQYPREAWEWAVSINDPAQQTEAAIKAAKMLAARDRSLARQYIESSPLPAQTKIELQAAIH